LAACLDEKNEFTIIKGFELHFDDQIIAMKFDRNNNLLFIGINGYNRLNWFGDTLNIGGGITPTLKTRLEAEGRQSRALHEEVEVSSLYERLYQNLSSAMKKYTMRGLADEEMQRLINSFSLGSSELMLKQFQKINQKTNIWQHELSSWSTDSEDFQDLRDRLIALKCGDLLSYLSNYISKVFLNVHYIEPVRATAQRYYRRQDTSVAEVDPSGQNVAMFIRSLSESDKRHFSQWMEENFGFNIRIKPSGSGHISLEIREKNGYRDTNIADTGFGFSQVLPILIQLWVIVNKKADRMHGEDKTVVIFAIEQPELHLHPRLQAVLADTFASALRTAKNSGIGMRIVIETHSETIVSRFGQMVSKGKIDFQDIGVNLFEKNLENGNTKIIGSHYNHKGILMNWPYGFFEPEIIK
jgi:hypothetical protein